MHMTLCDACDVYAGIDKVNKLTLRLIIGKKTSLLKKTVKI